MMRNPKIYLNALLLLLIVVYFSSCKWPNDAYNEIVSIKKEASAIVEKSTTESYTSQKNKIDALNARINALIALKTPKVGVKMLELTIDEARNTWGGFIRVYSQQGTLSAAAMPSFMDRVDQAFFEILSIGKKSNELSIF